MLIALIVLTGCGVVMDIFERVGPSPEAAPTQAPAGATGLGDLGTLSGVDALTGEHIGADVDGVSLYVSSSQIRGQVRGTLVNKSDKVLVDGELKFKFIVDFDDGCPKEIIGAKSFSSLGVSDRKPWRPGESREFSVSSDEHLPEVTGEFAAATTTVELFVYAEDPICYRGRGVIATLPYTWQAALLGAPAAGTALATRDFSLYSAPDGGTRLDKIEEGAQLSIAQVKGGKLQLRTPGGTLGWVDSDYVDLADASALFP